jgi:hypothetical protein
MTPVRLVRVTTADGEVYYQPYENELTVAVYGPGAFEIGTFTPTELPIAIPEHADDVPGHLPDHYNNQNYSKEG